MVRSRENPDSALEERLEHFETSSMIYALQNLYAKRCRDRCDVQIMDFKWNDSEPNGKGHCYGVTFLFDYGS